MKSKAFFKSVRRSFLIVIVLAIILNIFPTIIWNNENEITASAAEYTATTIRERFRTKMDSLGWVETSGTSFSISKVNDAMWQQDTNSMLVYKIDESKIDESTMTKKEKPTGNSVDKYESVGSNSVGYCLEVQDSTKSVLNYLALDESKHVSDYAYHGYSDAITPSTDDNTTTTSELITNVPDTDLYYTIEYDSVIGGCYRQYYVYSANQLALLLYYYETDFEGTLEATYEEYTSGHTEWKDVHTLGIVLLNDIDLGGDNTNSKLWKGYSNQSVQLIIDGQGHTIYNGYFKDIIETEKVTDDNEKEATKTYTRTNYFIGWTESYKVPNTNTDGSFETNDKDVVQTTTTSEYHYPKYFAIHDVTFSNMYMNRYGGMFGEAQYVYFNNVNWTHCLSANTSGNNTIVFGHSYLYVFLKDCTVDDSYVAGAAHCGLFASYNNSYSYSASKSYIGDTNLSNYIGESETTRDNTKTGFYYTSVPDSFEDVEIAWKGKDKKWTDNNTYWMTTDFPSIYENCATVNSAVYDTGTNHSGTFVSCAQGGIIFKNCFSNCTIYAMTELGVFLGAVIGSSDGFNYPYPNGDGTTRTEFVNDYFENCYTSGSIEGQTYLGGFVGMIFNDVYSNGNRNLKSTNRGRAVFRNCYSTSCVGMQYASDYTGGFCGLIATNIRAANETDRQHLFENCYAAGEVNDIVTDTSVDDNNTIAITDTSTYNTNSVGGFFGSCKQYSLTDYAKDYSTEANASGVDYSTNGIRAAEMINCYYDKQTTAMRERDIGAYQDIYKWGTTVRHPDNGYYLLAGSLKGLEGVYTKKSEAKDVQGLTDTENIMKSSDWNCSADDYYPQLKVFLNYSTPSNYDTLSAEAQKMHSNRAELYYNNAFASTATVLLDHYDEILTTNGKLRAATPDDADKLIYDTVRDITRKFEFTTDDDDRKTNDEESNDGETDNGEISHYIVWNNDKKRNEENGYKSTIDADGNGFNVSFETLENGETTTATKNHNPAALKIVYDEDASKWKCVEFAPGRQWVAVKAGSEQIGERQLRLLPTAYLNAGGTLTVNVDTDDNDDVTGNTVTYESHTLPSFNHSVGVAYAITDKTRMAGTNQTVSKYSLTDNNTESTDTTSFALYYGYRISDENSSAVGLNTDGEMYSQEFAVTGQDNNSSNGMTMVKVFYTTKVATSKDSTYKLKIGDEIKDADELKKWSGDAFFEAGDADYYYMEYYWRLDDGRYLTDEKLVHITSQSHTVKIITGILDRENSPLEKANDDGFIMPVDQFVTPGTISDISESSISKYYPSYNSSDESDSSDESEFDPAISYENYNTTKTYGGETYYIKSNTITVGGESTVGWYNMADYKLTALIVEVYNPASGWVKMTPSTDNTSYSYQFSTTEVTQDPDTKLFTIVETAGSKQTFDVNYVTLTDTDGKEGCIQFAFKDGELYDDESNLRVTALFRESKADVQVDKTVLNNFTVDLDTINSKSPKESFESAYESYEVDDAGITDNSKRKAVLSGDVLTYSMRLYNVGSDKSDVVDVYDTVPENCEYVPDSMKIYSQTKEYGDNTVTPKYGEVNEIKPDENNKYVAKYDLNKKSDGEELHWQIPEVSETDVYYLEYQVKVNQLSPAEQSETIENTATYDFVGSDGVKIENQSTNKVETDVTHLYINVKKKIDNDDPSQTFLFKIERFDSKDAYDKDSSSPVETFYTQIHCTTNTGSQLIQADKRGYYKITEITNWSNTDYKSVSVTSVTVSVSNSSVSFENASINGTITKSSSGDSIAFAMPRYKYTGGAFPTILGISDKGYYPTVTFTNKESEYAYLSAQAYAENSITINSNTEEESS